MYYRKPLPVASPESEPFWKATRAHRVSVQKCLSCARHWFPPAKLCPHCLSDQHVWDDVSGCGKVFSYVIFHRVFDESFAGDIPYIVALVQLDEGPRLISNLVDARPDEVCCEMPVQPIFEDVTPEVTLLKFKPKPRA
jgi:hypothetical protein